MKTLKFLVVVCLMGIFSACSSNISLIATSTYQPTEILTSAPTQIPTPTPTAEPKPTVTTNPPTENSNTNGSCINMGSLVKADFQRDYYKKMFQDNFPSFTESGWRWVDKWGTEISISKSITDENGFTSFTVNNKIVSVSGEIILTFYYLSKGNLMWLHYFPIENTFVDCVPMPDAKTKDCVFPWPDYGNITVKNGGLSALPSLKKTWCTGGTSDLKMYKAMYCIILPELCKEIEELGKKCSLFTGPSGKVYTWKPTDPCPTVTIN